MKRILDINKEPEQIAAAMEEFNEHSDEHARITVARKKADLFVARVHIGGRGGKPCRNVRRVKFGIHEGKFKVESHFGLLQIIEFLFLFAFFWLMFTLVLATVFDIVELGPESVFMNPCWIALVIILCVLLFFGIRTFWRDNYTYLYDILSNYIGKVLLYNKIVRIRDIEINLNDYFEEPVDEEKCREEERKEYYDMVFRGIACCSYFPFFFIFMLMVVSEMYLWMIISFLIEILIVAFVHNRSRKDEKAFNQTRELLLTQGHCYDACVKAYDFYENFKIRLWYEFKDEQGNLHFCDGVYCLVAENDEEHEQNADWVIGKTCKIWYYPGYRVLNEEVKTWRNEIKV
ncbi:MAG: hypothetical protein ACI4AQ_08130 [Lachnospiraceae bacterium]